MSTLVETAKVMTKGQITIPKDIRQALGVNTGDRVTFVVDNNGIRVMNSAIYAMQMLQSEMAGQASKAGLETEEEIAKLVKSIRQKNG